MVFCSPFKTFKDGIILPESDREFQCFGDEQENGLSHNEVVGFR